MLASKKKKNGGDKKKYISQRYSVGKIGASYFNYVAKEIRYWILLN